MAPNIAKYNPPSSSTHAFDGGGKSGLHAPRSISPDSYQHPERFWVDYVVEASSKEHARTLARELALEQTVELPGQIDAVREVEAYTVGSIERIELLRHHTSTSTGHDHSLYRVSIAYPNDTAGEELPQFLNVVFGNTSLKKGVSVENVTLSRHFMDTPAMFPGPKFGIQGLRDLLGVPQAPLLCTALKPMGKSSQEFADMAYALAKGGIDIIKDDHGLASQVWAPFEQRVQLCSEAVLRANRETGRNSLYAPCLNAPSDLFFERARYAKDCGAGAVMILPGITGWDGIRRLASDPTFGLPILVHPALLGGWLQSHPGHGHGGDEEEEHPRGLSHEFLFGALPRLCGGDAVIFPNAGGRFQFTMDECQQVAEGCRRPLGRFKSILPSPAGGMKLHRVEEMRKTFGDDTLFLIGGALLEQGPDLEADARMFAHCAGRDSSYSEPGLDVPRTSRDDDPKEAFASSSGPRPGANVAPKKAYVSSFDPPRRTATADSPKAVPERRDATPVVEVQKVANAVRRRVLEYTLRNNGGYLSQACSSAETLATLYLRSLNLGPSVADPIPGPFRGSPGPAVETITGEGHNGDPTDPSLDRLIFSPVHYALVLYSLLVEIGRLDIKAFESYNKDGSTVELIGAEHSPGHAVTAGSLAQALSQAAGISYARKLKGHSGRVVVYMSDGELQEGQIWEAVQAMVFHSIKVTAVVDINAQQCDGKMEQVCNIGSIANKLRAFGAAVSEVDGHSIQDIDAAVARTHNGPSFVLCYTHPCHGFPLLRSRAPKLHYVRFKDAAEKQQWEDVLAKMDPPRKIASNAKRGSPAPQTNQSVVLDTTHALTTTSMEQCSILSDVETVTRPHRKHLVEWITAHPKAIILTADLTSSCEADLSRDTLPNQYLSMGMAEQNMMSFAGGLAREGYHPFIHTFGVFITRRPFDQVAMSIGVPNLPVRLLGFLPGLTTPGGVTHQAIDDVALMRSIPNMRVLEVGDCTEVESVLDVAESIDGPVYIRMLRGEIPRLFPSPMKFGTSRLLSEGGCPLSRDSDIALVTTGICTEEAIKAQEMIRGLGVSILHLHLSTIVPFPADDILRICNFVKHGIITMENHSVVGGVGSATAEVLAEHAIAKPLIRLGVPANTYAHGASREYLVSEYGFDAFALIGAIEKLVGKKLKREWEPGQYQQAGADRVVNLLERPEDL
ncbi:hypothetical protein ACHAXT_005888 [Thalassiosira profunda]